MLYGLCGFYTAKAFAEALKKDDRVEKLDTITEHVYDTDEYLSDLAERSVNLAAKS